MGFWDIIVPEERTNSVLNPVAQGVGNYAAFNGSTVNVITNYSYLGYKCYEMIGVGANYWGIQLELSTLANAIHYVTLRLNIVQGAWSLAPAVSLDGVNYIATTLLSTEGDWRVYGAQISAAQSNGSVHLNVISGNESVVMYFGHFQVEPNTYSTTPITGDIKGTYSNGYYWNGLPHAASSTRSAKERSGGKIVTLDSLNAYVLSNDGIGMPPEDHFTQDQALLPGMLFKGSKVSARQFILTLDVIGTSLTNLHSLRKTIINYIKNTYLYGKQAFVLRYRGANSKPVIIYCIYDGGAGWNKPDGFTETLALRVIAYDPYFYSPYECSKVLTPSTTVHVQFSAQKRNGVWETGPGYVGGYVLAIAKGKDGKIYFGGSFTSTNIIVWDPYTQTYAQLGSGCNGIVRAIAVAPNGDVYVAGDFTSAGGVANTSKIAYWDVSAGVWVSVSATLPNGNVTSLAFDQAGNLWVSGAFTALGDANGNRLVKLTGAGWQSIGTGGANGDPQAICVAPNGNIFVTGWFTAIAGVSMNYIGRYDGTTWYPLGTGLYHASSVLPKDIISDQAGNVFVTGRFTRADNVDCNYIAMWNGETFEPLGSGLYDYGDSLAVDENGLVCVGGYFPAAGGLTTAGYLAIWNRSSWANMGITIPSLTETYSILLTREAQYFGINTHTDVPCSSLTTVTNNGSEDAYPKVIFKRGEDGTSAIVEFLKNETCGDTIWLNYALQKGEELTIDLNPSNPSLISSFYGSVPRAVLRNSDMASFRLVPGDNKISSYVNPTGSPTITAYMLWRNTYASVDGAA